MVLQKQSRNSKSSLENKYNMTKFVTSDIHFNHKNIVIYQPNRGTLDIPTMNENIIRAWNEDVQPEDEVFILGDVAMGRIELAPALIRRLNGTKHLILGNHDKSLKKLMDQDPEVRGMFGIVEHYHEMMHSVDGKKYSLCMMHFPIAHWAYASNGTMMLHGHLHGHPSGQAGRIKDVGMDTNHMRVYKLDDVVRELAKVEVKGSHHGD
jgi:calcineurin-like phosphoesterase family protein